MSFKAVLRAIAFLCLLFVVLYVGMKNPHQIDFQFPIAGTTAKDPIRAQAAIIFFAMFAAGVFAGMMLHTEKPAKKSSGSKDR